MELLVCITDLLMFDSCLFWDLPSFVTDGLKIEKDFSNWKLFDYFGRKSLKVEILNCLGSASFQSYTSLIGSNGSQSAQQHALNLCLSSFSAAFDLESDLVSIVNLVCSLFILDLLTRRLMSSSTLAAIKRRNRPATCGCDIEISTSMTLWHDNLPSKLLIARAWISFLTMRSYARLSRIVCFHPPYVSRLSLPRNVVPHRCNDFIFLRE